MDVQSSVKIASFRPGGKEKKTEEDGLKTGLSHSHPLFAGFISHQTP
jgi:hypothetical protein